ncbi:hypothetical protein GCM10028807_34550 [Spirosoma daeguense]
METPYGELNFKFLIGGWDSEKTILKTKQNNVYYFRSEYPFRDDEARVEYDFGEPEVIQVDRAALYVMLLPCLDWESLYDEGILDGEQWTLDIEMEGKRLHCYGSNVYPDDFYAVIGQIEWLIGRQILGYSDE